MSTSSSTQAVSSDVAELKGTSSSRPAPQTHGGVKTDFEKDMSQPMMPSVEKTCKTSFTSGSGNSSCGNPTPYFEPIVSTASPNLTPFGDSDFLLMEEADSFLALEDDPTSSEVDPTYQDPEGDIPDSRSTF
ncbi:hypothetical protein Tco_1440174 [Tanacetum coccineum]